MLLNHLNLPVPNPAILAQFFCDCFDFRILTENSFIIVLGGEGGFILNIMRDSAADYPVHFHVGFTLRSREELEAAHSRMLDRGYEAGAIEHIRRPTGYEAMEFMAAIGGVNVELQTPLSI